MDENKKKVIDSKQEFKHESEVFGDPLDHAFNTDEVNRVGGNIGSVTGAYSRY